MTEPSILGADAGPDAPVAVSAPSRVKNRDSVSRVLGAVVTSCAAATPAASGAAGAGMVEEFAACAACGVRVRVRAAARVPAANRRWIPLIRLPVTASHSDPIERMGPRELVVVDV